MYLYFFFLFFLCVVRTSIFLLKTNSKMKCGESSFYVKIMKYDFVCPDYSRNCSIVMDYADTMRFVNTDFDIGF